jgi:hypothetical protein
MDRIEFAIERRELGVGAQECVEAVINGERITDILASVEPMSGGYAGLRPDELFRR